MRFAVESWAPEYGTAFDSPGSLDPSDAAVDVNAEVAADQWRPLDPAPGRPVEALLFIDGVRRIDARVWITDDPVQVREGICASYAAGAVRCDGSAQVVSCHVRRGLFTTAADQPIVTAAARYQPYGVAGDSPEELSLGVQQRMGELEVEVAGEVAATHAVDMVVIDGPLTGRQGIAGAVGYVKTHRVSYLPPVVATVVAGLAPGQRTPLFAISGSWSRWSWYLRLPHGAGHPWAGVVRMEVSADTPWTEAAAVADRLSAALPRFASHPAKDGRAPQNLYPIAGLERRLRHRLGDPLVLERALRRAAAA